MSEYSINLITDMDISLSIYGKCPLCNRMSVIEFYIEDNEINGCCEFCQHGTVNQFELDSHTFKKLILECLKDKLGV